MPDIAALAQRATVQRLWRWADAAPAQVRVGRGWSAIRTGTANNDLNAVVSEPGAEISDGQVADLLDWFADVPACWLSTAPDPALTARLIAFGARPEQTGHWAGCSLTASGTPQLGGVAVQRISSEADLDGWLHVADELDWTDGADDRDRRRRLMISLGLDHPALRWWIAESAGEPVGFAGSCLVDDVVELSDVGVLPGCRRQGLGTALIETMLHDAVADGARDAVAAPSPDGWALLRSMGFALAPVLPDTCCYLPGQD